MKGQGNKKNPVIQPKVLTGKTFTPEQTNNAVAVSPKQFDMPASIEPSLSQVEPGKVKDKTVVQQKPESSPLIVPLAPNPVMPTTKSKTSMGRPSGGVNASKSIPSKNPKNFYPMFAAIQYNCMADF